MRILDIDFCTAADIDGICAVEEACFDVPWSRRTIVHDLDDQGAVVYMKASTDKGVIAGYAVLAMDEGASHLMNLAVLPEHREQGVAKQLLLAMEVLSEEWGYKKMMLEVRPDNRAARDLYSSVGFLYSHRRKKYYSNGEDALVLVADLPLNMYERYVF